MNERTRLFWLLLTGGVALGGVAIADPFGGVPHTFQADTVISASQMNANFAAINAELISLRASVGGAPTGTVVAFAGPKTTIPPGWRLCNGDLVARTGEFASLYAAIGTVHGHGDGATTFSLPDYRGLFLRGVDDGRGKDPDAMIRGAAALGGNIGDLVGTIQSDAFTNHDHDFRNSSGTPGGGIGTIPTHTGTGAPNNTLSGRASSTGAVALVSGPTVRTSTETRPANATVHYIIKL